MIIRGTMVATTGTATGGSNIRLIGATVRIALLVMVVLIAGVMVLVAPTTAPGGTGAGAIVIMPWERRKCSWFKVELRRLGGAGGILLLLLHVAAVG